MKFDVGYSAFTLKEIENYEHFDFICDGDKKIITCIEKTKPKKDNSLILDILRKEIGENAIK